MSETSLTPLTHAEFKKIIEDEFRNHMPEHADLPLSPLINIHGESEAEDHAVHLAWLSTDLPMYTAIRLLPESLVKPWIPEESEPRFFDVEPAAYSIIIHYLRNFKESNNG